MRETCKSIFPFKLNDLNYMGLVPEFSLFEGITLDEYENYKAQYNFANPAFLLKKRQSLPQAGVWDFKEEAPKYCTIDCIALYQILSKFNQLIFDYFQISPKLASPELKDLCPTPTHVQALTT
jgi:hypothetical protein